MKKVFKFAGFAALLLTLIGFILLLATSAVTYEGHEIAKGTDALFGRKEGMLDIDPSPLSLIAWIFVLLAMLALGAKVVLDLMKKQVKFGRILELCISIVLLVSAIMLFFTVPTFYSANGASSVPDNVFLGAGWIVASIFFILSGGALCAKFVLKAE